MTLEYPDDLRYRDTHEYVRLAAGVATVGISIFAIDRLGDLVFLELPEIGDTVEAGESFGNIESVKAVEELYSPVSGTVTEINEAAIDTPELISEDPYGEGWLLKIRVNDPEAKLNDTFSAEEYRDRLEGED